METAYLFADLFHIFILLTSDHNCNFWTLAAEMLVLDCHTPSCLSYFLSIMQGSQTLTPEASVPSAGDRRKWQAGDVALSVAQQTLQDTSLFTAGEILMESDALHPFLCVPF